MPFFLFCSEALTNVKRNLRNNNLLDMFIDTVVFPYSTVHAVTKFSKLFGWLYVDIT